MNALKLWLKDYTSSEVMAVSIVLWLCSLVAVGLVVTPWLGPQVAWRVALAMLLIALLSCWTTCIVRVVRKSRRL